MHIFDKETIGYLFQGLVTILFVLMMCVIQHEMEQQIKRDKANKDKP